jgi:nucleoid-associated protein YgaU
MKRLPALLVLLILGQLAACSTSAPAWRPKATVMMDDLVRQNAHVLFPQEYHNLLETFEHGEAVLLVQGDEQKADTLYLLTLQKGALLKDELLKRKQRMADEQRQKDAVESARIEEERLMLQAAEAEARLREQERRSVEVIDQAPAALKETSKEPIHPQMLRYTVRRGETLPQIAARTEIYNDSSLWPLIYRANRDQIRDPKQLWPGQVLKIPRHFTRDEALEAKRYSGKK